MTYWLSRKGGAAEGPFTQGQILRMWEAGEITLSDQVCEHGLEDWVPAHTVVEEVEERRRAADDEQTRQQRRQAARAGKAVRKRVGYGGCAFLILALIAFAFLPMLGLGLFLLALIVDFMLVKTVCSVCGNEVVKSSRECPACRARLN